MNSWFIQHKDYKVIKIVKIIHLFDIIKSSSKKCSEHIVLDLVGIQLILPVASIHFSLMLASLGNLKHILNEG